MGDIQYIVMKNFLSVKIDRTGNSSTKITEKRAKSVLGSLPFGLSYCTQGLDSACIALLSGGVCSSVFR
jgi:hypothetical protein